MLVLKEVPLVRAKPSLDKGIKGLIFSSFSAFLKTLFYSDT